MKKYFVIEECFSYPEQNILFEGTREQCKDFINNHPYGFSLNLAYVEED